MSKHYDLYSQIQSAQHYNKLAEVCWKRAEETAKEMTNLPDIEVEDQILDVCFNVSNEDEIDAFLLERLNIGPEK